MIKDQIEKECEAKELALVKYLTEVRKMERHSRGFTVEHLPRRENNEADDLAKKASRNEQMSPDIFFEIIWAPLIKQNKQPLSMINSITSLDWRSPIIAYLRENYEPIEDADSKRMKQRARGYVMKDDALYKLGVSAPMLKCISQKEGIELLKEIHGGMCGSHIATRASVGKAFLQGFYWPMAIKDAEKIVKTCKAC